MIKKTWKQGQLLWWGYLWCEIVLGEKALGVTNMTNSYKDIPGKLSNLPQTNTLPLIMDPEEWKEPR